MAKIKLKKSLQLVLENSKQAVIKAISESMMLQPPTESEVAWLLLEFTLEYPFPPTIALAQKHEVEQYEDSIEHPLACYNAADIELFSENKNIILDVDTYAALFETVDELFEEIEYEDRQPFMFQLYVDVCKALMLESVHWTHLKLAADFHVTARDFEICDEAVYLKKLLPKKVYNKLQKKLDAYEVRIYDVYKNDETILKVNAVVDIEANRYEDLLASLNLDCCTDVFCVEEIYFLKPFHVETSMHKRAYEIERELSTQRPTDANRFYHYKFSNNIPQLLDYYHDGMIIWRKIFRHIEDDMVSYHRFYLKSGKPVFEDYAVLKNLADLICYYEKYSCHNYDSITYYKNEQEQITHSTYYRCIFQVGYKMDSVFEYLFEYKNDDLFKISCANENGRKSVSYCKDDSFMEEAIDAFIDHLCAFTIGKMKTQSLDGIDAVVLVYDSSLSFYFNINLLINKIMHDISTYEQYENDSAMMNLSVYTSERITGPEKDYFTREKAEYYVEQVYIALCSTLSQRIYDNFQISIPVVTKFIHDELDL